MDPEEIRASIQYLLNGQREDGCIPDRVNIEGEPVYSPGPPKKPMADHAVDNGPFMALLVCSYVNQFNDEQFFRDVESKLREGLDFIRLKESGLVYNDPKDPQCVYGFTDIVKKTGNLLFSSLIYYKACLEMEQLCQKTERGDPSVYKRRAEYIGQTINKLWDEQSGMFWAADKDCQQIDIWGSAYAVEVGITSKEQTNRIAEYLITNYDEIAWRGQFRHLPGGDKGWNNLFKPFPEGTYQNGAYWATPLAWIIPVIAKRNMPLAKQILKTVIDDFRENEINECINENYVKIPNYVVSATNVYVLTR
jgi:glycogen debranching enzyme